MSGANEPNSLSSQPKKKVVRRKKKKLTHTLKRRFIVGMPKRKRDESAPRGKPVPTAERLLDDGRRNVAGALKVCQRFERQKLGRRVKDTTAAGDEDSVKTLERLNREIQALKVRLDS
jgi:hypothetical protein